MCWLESGTDHSVRENNSINEQAEEELGLKTFKLKKKNLKDTLKMQSQLSV